jgi:protein-arginine kinase activator protein McsA
MNGTDEEDHHHRHNSDQFHVPKMETHEMTRKREVKAASKFVCKGCNTRYSKLRKMGFCHNCFLIYEAVETCVRQQDGQFEFYQVN